MEKITILERDRVNMTETVNEIKKDVPIDCH